MYRPECSSGNAITHAASYRGVGDDVPAQARPCWKAKAVALARESTPSLL
jgi:hypothetical protein